MEERQEETGIDIEEMVAELRMWLKENWDPDLNVGEWWERLGMAGWASPGLPTNAYGRGFGRNDVVRVQKEIADFGALSAPAGLGLLLAAPTIATHGTEEQINTYVRDIVLGNAAWCQLFSEPGAGSDLAGLSTRAIKDGDEWIIDGQKVWTSLGSTADFGMLLARTDADVPKHQGITWFALPMHQPGIEVRPLREMTGHSMFNEVFLSAARVRDDAIIGGKNKGWAVANTTLAHERSGLGAGGGSAGAGGAAPGTVAKQLGMRAGDLAPSAKPKTPKSAKVVGGASSGSSTGPAGVASGGYAAGATLLTKLARENGSLSNPVVRQDLARLHTLGELARFNNLRSKAARRSGKDIPGMANLSKLAMSQLVRMTRDLGLRIVGPAGMLHAYENEEKATLAGAGTNPALPIVTAMALFAQAPPIYGGTDQIQRNIVAERVLGLPKEPNRDRELAFADLPRNA